MSRQIISATLAIENGNIVCIDCGRALVEAGQSWKRHAALTSTPIKDLPGAASAVDAKVVLRYFACPGCGSLLDTETALPEDPFLDDVVRV
ncbi:MAG: acetone carboxylase subunit gamma [Sterolibacterium sp.]